MTVGVGLEGHHPKEDSMSGKFEAFAALHVPGDPVILFNAWDAGSAAAVERAGGRAIATGSWSVAAAQGYADAQAIPLALALANAVRIVGSVAVPVTIDFEGGYAVDPEPLAANMAALAATGAVGCNFEDQVIGAASRSLHPIDVQATRVAAARQATGPAFFLNARTDVFLANPAETHDDAMADEAIERAQAYAAAGASGFFVPGLVDLGLLERVCKASPLPVNVMAFPGAPSAHALAGVGVARISHGPYPYRAMIAGLEAAAREAFSY
ncbi:MAG: isocitrate lyase/phosphoenolpyruvate mutase family protein [Novosphingobium sp.]|nr:isocitrate lyase/phosphoenolpyruvate mutase family protein [Novosphingobium sp.]